MNKQRFIEPFVYWFIILLDLPLLVGIVMFIKNKDKDSIFKESLSVFITIGFFMTLIFNVAIGLVLWYRDRERKNYYNLYFGINKV